MDIGRQPWPESLAGAVMGTLGIIGIAFTPLARYIEQPSTAPLVLLVGAAIGFALSWWYGTRSMRKIVRAEHIVEESQRDGQRHAA